VLLPQRQQAARYQSLCHDAGILQSPEIPQSPDILQRPDMPQRMLSLLDVHRIVPRALALEHFPTAWVTRSGKMRL
jgi:hypothetical protein